MENTLKNRKFIGLIVLLIIVGGVIVFEEQRRFSDEEEVVEEIEEEEIEEPKLQIIDQDSNRRALAVMINNHPRTIPHHAGIQDAFIVYEIIVEGSFTRLMALYREQATPRIGSLRSARHYFLDYALEHDAVFIHFGGSPQSYTDIRSLGVNNLDFMSRSAFFRDNSLNVALEHRAYSRMELIYEELTKMNMRLTSDNQYLNYQIEPVVLTGENVFNADQIEIIYSRSNRVGYQYHDGVYYRFYNGNKHSDAVSKEQFNFKNLLIKEVRNYLMGSGGRQELDTVGSGKGYFLTDGKAKPITWTKESRSSKTVYRYESGEEVAFNDGNTMINVVPVNTTVNITGEVNDNEEENEV